MPEVNARLEQLLHGDISQLTSSFGLHPERQKRPPRIAIFASACAEREKN
jgi:hypothetical protein